MKKSLTVWLSLALLCLSCATTGPGGKQSVIIVPTSQEVAIGAGMAQQVESTEQVLPDSVWQAYLNEVGQKIVAVCDRKDIEYRFRVIQSEQVNAFAAPGGFVYFYTGLLKKIDNEGEMAAVLSHEISHVVARHGIKRLQAAMGVSLAYELVFGGEGASKALDAAINIGMSLAFASYSRSNEREADAYGITYMTAAGYDPHAAVTMFEKLAALGGEGSTNIFEQLSSSHPDTQERIANAQQEIASMTLPTGLTESRDRYQKMIKRLP